jgi:hypothetical protein
VHAWSLQEALLESLQYGADGAFGMGQVVDDDDIEALLEGKVGEASGQGGFMQVEKGDPLDFTPVPLGLRTLDGAQVAPVAADPLAAVVELKRAARRKETPSYNEHEEGDDDEGKPKKRRAERGEGQSGKTKRIRGSHKMRGKMMLAAEDVPRLRSLLQQAGKSSVRVIVDDFLALDGVGAAKYTHHYVKESIFALAHKGKDQVPAGREARQWVFWPDVAVPDEGGEEGEDKPL